MTFRSRMRVSRESLAYLAPSAVVIVAMLMFRDSTESILWTVVAGAIGALFVTTIALLGYALCYWVIRWIAGVPKPESQPWDSIHGALAGVLLAIAVSIWWRANERRRIDYIVECSQEHAGEFTSLVDLVETCNANVPFAFF